MTGPLDWNVDLASADWHDWQNLAIVLIALGVAFGFGWYLRSREDGD